MTRIIWTLVTVISVFIRVYILESLNLKICLLFFPSIFYPLLLVSSENVIDRQKLHIYIAVYILIELGLY